MCQSQPVELHTAGPSSDGPQPFPCSRLLPTAWPPPRPTPCPCGPQIHFIRAHLHGRVEDRRVHEAHADLIDTAGHPRCVQLHSHPQGLWKERCAEAWGGGRKVHVGCRHAQPGFTMCRGLL